MPGTDWSLRLLAFHHEGKGEHGRLDGSGSGAACRPRRRNAVPLASGRGQAAGLHTEPVHRVLRRIEFLDNDLVGHRLEASSKDRRTAPRMVRRSPFVCPRFQNVRQGCFSKRIVTDEHRSHATTRSQLMRAALHGSREHLNSTPRADHGSKGCDQDKDALHGCVI